MEIKILESDKNMLKIELIGKSHTLANALSKELWNDKDVVMAGYNIDHPLVSNAVLMVATSKAAPKKALSSAITRLNKKNKDFLAQVKKVAK